MANRRGKVLVTGGAGFIGSHLVERLVREGLGVRVLDDFSSGRAENLAGVSSCIELISGSILNPELLERAAEGCGCIFHLAAVVSVPRSIAEPDRVHEVNATGTLAVIEAAKCQGARVIFSSSAAVYGACPSRIQSEGLPFSPISPYGAQKCLGEMYLQTYHRTHGLESFSLRYFNVYGPRQDAANPYSGVISIFSHRAEKGQDLMIFGDGSQTRDYVHVDDVVAANLAAMSASDADGRALNIGTGRPTDLNRVADTIVRLNGGRSRVRYAEARVGDILHSCAEVEAARRRLGFQATVEIEAGLESLHVPAEVRSH